MKSSGMSVLDAEMACLDDLGLLVNDQQAAQRLLRLIGALAALNERPCFDEHGRCRVCRSSRRGRRRRACTVYEAFLAYRIGNAGGSGS